MKYIFIILGMLIFSVWPLSSDIVDNYNFTYYRIEDGLHDELNAPETIVKGEDTQLKAAVDELLKELDAKK